jgi:hypothetical protein
LHTLTGYSPVVEIDNQTHEYFTKLVEKPDLTKKLEKMGPELSDDPIAPNFMLKNIHKIVK